MAQFQQRVFSGVQPTGNLHLGNYLGAIKRFVAMQATHDCIYCVVDMHAITLPQDPAELTHQIREVTAAFIAAGIDPKKHIVFNQSQVSEHAELAWVFNCVARLGWLNRMTQFKEKAGKDRENASVGLYAYPVLMAADILVYRATHVPVGEDQKQHLELTRDIAQKFNNDWADSIAEHGFGDAFFPLTEPLIQGPATRVMSLARRLEEDVEIRPVRLFAHQPDRRCRHDRPEGPQGEDRPRAAALRGEGLKARPEAENLVGIYAALTDGTVAGRARASTAARSSPAFKAALVDVAVDEARADRRRDAPPHRRSRPYRRDPRGRRRARPRDRRADHGRRQGHRRLRPGALRLYGPDGPALAGQGIVASAEGDCVSSKRRSFETGHRPKFMVVDRRDARMRPRRPFRGAARGPHRREPPDARRRSIRRTISSGSASARR